MRHKWWSGKKWIQHERIILKMRTSHKYAYMLFWTTWFEVINIKSQWRVHSLHTMKNVKHFPFKALCIHLYFSRCCMWLCVRCGRNMPNGCVGYGTNIRIVSVRILMRRCCPILTTKKIPSGKNRLGGNTFEQLNNISWSGKFYGKRVL